MSAATALRWRSACQAPLRLPRPQPAGATFAHKSAHVDAASREVLPKLSSEHLGFEPVAVEFSDTKAPATPPQPDASANPR